MLDVDPGFRADHLLAFDVVQSGGGPMTRHLEFFQRVLDRLAHEPGVESASAVMCPPITGTCWTSPCTSEGVVATAASQWPWTAMNMVVPSYFQTMRIPLVEGRLFTPADKPRHPRWRWSIGPSPGSCGHPSARSAST